MKQSAKKILIGIVGGTVLAIGIALLVLPGPAFIVIPIGLAILATEFVWAERLKARCEQRFKHWREERRKRKKARQTQAA
jgi:tellurite resistance protein TerC